MSIFNFVIVSTFYKVLLLELFYLDLVISAFGVFSNFLFNVIDIKLYVVAY